MTFKPKALTLPALVAAMALASWKDTQAQVLDALMRFRDPVGEAKKATGESDNEKFPGKDGWFDILSFDFGVNNRIDITESAGGGRAAGKATFTDFTITKNVDSASPALFETSAKGGNFAYADLVLLQGGSSLQNKPFYSAILKNVYIASVQWTRSISEAPVETVKAPFEALQWTYTRYSDKGFPITALTVNWNQVSNKGGDGSLVTVLPVLTYPATQSISTGTSLDVQPLSGPSDNSGIINVTVKSTGGYTGGISVDPVTGTVHLTNPQPEGGPFNIVIEASALDSLSVDASFALTVSSSTPALVANPDSASRVLGRSIKIPIATLVGNDTAGAVFESLPSGVTTLGGHVAVSGSVVYYEPPIPDPGTDDSFTYQIHDTFSQTAVGTVTVQVSTPDGITRNLILKLGATGELNLQLAGIPGRKYQLQSAPSVTGPWDDLGIPATADANGSAAWSDSHPDSDKFYRAFETP